MTAFHVAAAAMFRDRNMAVDALYRPGGVDPAQALRVLRTAPDQVASYGDARLVSDSTVIWVRIADVAVLARGDSFEIGGELLAVQGDPVRDAEQLVWTAEVRAL